MSFREEVEPVTWPPTWNIGCLDTLTEAVLLGLLGFTVETHMSVCPSKGHFHREIWLDAVLSSQGRRQEVFVQGSWSNPEVPRAWPFTLLGVELPSFGERHWATWAASLQSLGKVEAS